METVYIAGKVTGLDYEIVTKKFNEAEIKLRKKGYNVVNPLRLANKWDKWHIAMRKCLSAMINECDAIYLLDNWNQDSKGAELEYKIANKLKFKLIEL